MNIEVITAILSLITALVTAIPALPLTKKIGRPAVWVGSFSLLTIFLIVTSYSIRGYEVKIIPLRNIASPTILAGNQNVGGAPRYTLNLKFELDVSGKIVWGLLSGRINKNGGEEFFDINKDSGKFEVAKFDSRWESVSVSPPYLNTASISKIPDGAVSQFTTVHMKGRENEPVDSWEVTGLATPSVRIHFKPDSGLEIKRRAWLPLLWVKKIMHGDDA